MDALRVNPPHPCHWILVLAGDPIQKWTDALIWAQCQWRLDGTVLEKPEKDHAGPEPWRGCGGATDSAGELCSPQLKCATSLESKKKSLVHQLTTVSQAPWTLLSFVWKGKSVWVSLCVTSRMFACVCCSGLTVYSALLRLSRCCPSICQYVFWTTSPI